LAAGFDFRQYRVPNFLTLPLCLSGLLFHGVLGGVDGLRFSAGGLALGGLLLILFYIMGVMGAGDVKLLAGVGAWVGAAPVQYVFLVAAVAGGIHSLIALTIQGRLRQVGVMFQVSFLQLCSLGRFMTLSEPVAALAGRPDRRRYVMPFAVMIAIGLAVVAIGGLIASSHAAA
jgi:prepilin peptidase CpaA